MKKGFTLIELLAVIVILAIIALIATPIILNIIENAREEANKRSIELYASAVKNAIASYQLKTGLEPETFNDIRNYIEYEGDVECTTEELYEEGSIYITGCTVNDQEVEYAYGKKFKPCTYVDSEDDTGEAIGTIDLSDVVTCGTESFYVMENDGSNITMLSMYNLDVGNIRDKSTGSWVTSAIENPTGIQSPRALGYVSGATEYYGTVAFSTTDYWLDENYAYTIDTNYKEEGRKYPYVYGDYEGSVVYPYVNAYETYLKESLKVSSASASLMSYEQATVLGCSISSDSCTSAPEWVYSTSYYLGNFSLDVYGSFWQVTSDGDFNNDGRYCGVRPIITISTSEIK